MTSMLTPTNRNAAVIIGNRRRDDDFVINPCQVSVNNIKSFINVESSSR